MRKPRQKSCSKNSEAPTTQATLCEVGATEDVARIKKNSDGILREQRETYL